VPLQVTPPSFNGDLMEGLTLLTEGDSAVFRIPVDSLLKMGNQPLPWIKSGVGQMVEYEVKVTSVRNQQQMKQQQDESAAKQKGIDDKILQQYFAQNKIKATKTPSGLYYRITKQGTGPMAQKGQTMVMNYTGKTLDGNPFDSNVDPKFNHVQPFKFMLGMGQVIKGWDEGIALLKKGSKATLYIPSPLAYGAQSPSPAIPSNGILMFDVELVDIEGAATAPAAPATGAKPAQGGKKPAAVKKK
jgi:FKBP-type peptidyl-prolyl cis-trans isomerase